MKMLRALSAQLFNAFSARHKGKSQYFTSSSQLTSEAFELRQHFVVPDRSRASKSLLRWRFRISERDSLINFMMNLLSPIMKCEPFRFTFSTRREKNYLPERRSTARGEKVERQRVKRGKESIWLMNSIMNHSSCFTPGLRGVRLHEQFLLSLIVQAHNKHYRRWWIRIRVKAREKRKNK